MTVTMDKILCATDGSVPAAKTVAFAVELAQRLALPLSFITVVDMKEGEAPTIWDAAALLAGKLPVDKALLSAVELALRRPGCGGIAAVRAPGNDIAQYHRRLRREELLSPHHHRLSGAHGGGPAADRLGGRRHRHLCPLSRHRRAVTTFKAVTLVR